MQRAGSRKLILGLTVLVVFALSEFWVATAQGAEGPNWRLKGALLLQGVKKEIAIKQVGELEIIATGWTVKCSTVETTGAAEESEIIGGKPGTGIAHLKYTVCSGTGFANGCTATTAGKPAGEIGPFKTRSVLVYPEPRGLETIALDAFTAAGPEQTENTLTTYVLAGTCADKGLTVTLGPTAGSTEIKTVKGEQINKKCLMVAEVGEITLNKTFMRTASTIQSSKGGLNFPSPRITKAEVWEGAWTKETCELEAQVGNNIKETTRLQGILEVQTVPAEPFGWEK